MSRLPADWTALVGEHAVALEEFGDAVRGLPAGRWAEPLAPGKWTPAEVTGHLAESYQVLRSELNGGPGMRMVVPPVRRWLLRRLLVPRLLHTGRFPAGARAPRETRPRRVEPGPEEGLAALARHTEGFTEELAARASAGRVRLTHAYFGRLDLRDGLRLCIVHIRHHARQLAAIAG